MSLRQLVATLALLPALLCLTAAELSAASEQDIWVGVDQQAVFTAISELHEVKSQADQLANNAEEYYLCNVKGNWRYREDPKAYNNGGCFLMGKSRLIKKTTTSKSFLLS